MNHLVSPGKADLFPMPHVFNGTVEPVRHPDGSMHRGEGDEVYNALKGGARLYLDTWVIPALEMILPGEGRDVDLARRLSGR